MKKLEVLKNTLRYTIDGSVIDYDLHYDITGKIYETKALLYDLPQHDQQLILGENIEEKKNKIKHFENLLTLILPLGIVNQNRFLIKILLWSILAKEYQKEKNIKKGILTSLN